MPTDAERVKSDAASHDAHNFSSRGWPLDDVQHVDEQQQFASGAPCPVGGALVVGGEASAAIPAIGRIKPIRQRRLRLGSCPSMAAIDESWHAIDLIDRATLLGIASEKRGLNTTFTANLTAHHVARAQAKGMTMVEYVRRMLTQVCNYVQKETGERPLHIVAVEPNLVQSEGDEPVLDEKRPYDLHSAFKAKDAATRRLMEERLRLAFAAPGFMNKSQFHFDKPRAPGLAGWVLYAAKRASAIRVIDGGDPFIKSQAIVRTARATFEGLARESSVEGALAFLERRRLEMRIERVGVRMRRNATSRVSQ